MSKKPLHLNLEGTPRIWLFYFAVLVQLAASAVSGTGFVLNSPPFLLAGPAIWVVWFIMIFIVVLPGTDKTLRTKTRFLKCGALTIFVSLFVLGLFEVISLTLLLPRFLQTSNVSNDFPQLMDGFNRVFEYNDGTALS